MSIRDKDTAIIIYECGDCKRNDCKLWRKSNCLMDWQELRCFECIAKRLPHRPTGLLENGSIDNPMACGRKTDQVGRMVPAVLTPDRCAMYAYIGVPTDAAESWKKLPN